ncbi:MipA/OmpV family protein [Psychromonas sp.]|uniref:MipA/OmpV family protein n=1 Tax=Psychromonas sp. TaxID=1884585 RepID=UPI00356875B0
MNTDKTLHRVEEAKANAANTLSLAEIELSKLPDKLLNLHKLIELRFSYNQLANSITPLTRLTTLIVNSSKSLLRVLIICSFIQSAFAAEKKPLWEYGVGAAGWYSPHYLGSDQQQAYLIPVPYFVYRGKTIRADNEGLRGLLFSSDKLDLRLSVSAVLPVDSKDNDAREGMEDLDFMVEVGPTLQYQLFQAEQQQLRFDLPIRAAFTLGGEFLNHQGWTANPRLQHELQLQGWALTTTAGLVFSDRRYHGYIYNVNQADVRADRSFYQSSSGFTGSRFSAGIKRQFGNLYVGALVSYYNLSGSANNDSPLLRQDDYLSASMIIAWVLGNSNKLVDD